MPLSNSRVGFRQDERVELNQLRLVCREGDRGSLHVKSTLDSTYKLDERTDESISFTDNDLVVIKNVRESKCRVGFETIRLPRAARMVLRPSRQAALTLTSREDSEIRCKAVIELGGGESITISTSNFIARTGASSYKGTV
jgi:hypothetical protein